jgi:predicted amidophosphoribosyltransferase
MADEPKAKEKISCPDCGKEAEKGTRRCPECDYPLGTDTDLSRIRKLRERDNKGKKEKSIVDEIFD